MSKANWVQFKGNYWIDDIDRELFDQLKTLFEGGVRLWHNYSELSSRTEMSDNNVIAQRFGLELKQVSEPYRIERFVRGKTPNATLGKEKKIK